MAKKIEEGSAVLLFIAYMELLKEGTPPEKINIIALVEKALMARQTYYHYYKNVDDIIIQLLSDAIDDELLSVRLEANTEGGKDLCICYNYNVIAAHLDVIQYLMEKPHISKLINDFNRENILSIVIERCKNILEPSEFVENYQKLIFQVGGSLTVYLDWFNKGMQIPLEEFILSINDLASSKEKKYPNLPKIVIKVIYEDVLLKQTSLFEAKMSSWKKREKELKKLKRLKPKIERHKTWERGVNHDSR